MLGLPLLPTFTDAQFKLKTRFDEHNELTVLGLAGIDNMKLNTSLEGEKAEYILSYLPKIQQETFTLGAVYRHYAGAHVQSVVISHSYLNNRNTKYLHNDESTEENLTLRLRSVEQETKLRLENSSAFGAWKVNLGLNLDYSQYTNTSFQRVYIQKGETFDYHTALGLVRWGIFGTMSYASPDERFTASLGVRTDANNYSSRMNKLSEQLSPRLSLSYRLIDGLYASGSAGLYYQLPPYTQAKLVRVVEGEVLDVVVDLRKNSATFGKHVAVVLSGENKRQFFIPKGFAHGFAVLSPQAVFQYKCDNYYAPQYERGIQFDDPALGIDWKIPEAEMILSAKDRMHKRLEEAFVFEG